MIKTLGMHRVLALNTLLGPLTGLNIRNLAWHGFVLPEAARLMGASCLILTHVPWDRRSIIQPSSPSCSWSR